MIVQSICNWVIADLKIDAQFDIEDAELMRLGFTWSEIQQLPIYRRREVLEANSIVSDWKKIIERRRTLEIGMITNGFSEKDTRVRIQKSWDSEATENLDRLRRFTYESKPEQPKPIKKTRKFIDVLKGLKNGAIKNSPIEHGKTARAHETTIADGNTSKNNPVLS